jgi:hypothetical protein
MAFELPSNFGDLLNEMTHEHIAARMAERQIDRRRHEIAALRYGCELLRSTNLREMQQQFEDALQYIDRETADKNFDWYGECFSTDRRFEQFLQKIENVIFSKYGVDKTSQRELGSVLERVRHLIREYPTDMKSGELTGTLIQLEQLVCVNADIGEDGFASYNRRKTTYKVIGWSFVVANAAAIPWWPEPFSIKASMKGGGAIIKASDKFL